MISRLAFFSCAEALPRHSGRGGPSFCVRSRPAVRSPGTSGRRPNGLQPAVSANIRDFLRFRRRKIRMSGKRTGKNNCFFRANLVRIEKSDYLCPRNGGLAQLARALAWHARGHEFESRILHQSDGNGSPAKYSFAGFYIFENNATKCRQTHITRSLFGAPCVSEKTGTPNKDSMRCIT